VTITLYIWMIPFALWAALVLVASHGCHDVEPLHKTLGIAVGFVFMSFARWLP